MTARHPAPFPDDVVRLLDWLIPVGTVEDPTLVLDPLAGIGRIHRLAKPGRKTVGVEIEHDWAVQGENTWTGDARDQPWKDDTFDVVATSPPYGNRLADDTLNMANQRRISYSGYLGRALVGGNAAAEQWGAHYKVLMGAVFEECRRVLKPRGTMIVNVKDHVRGGEPQGVPGWYIMELGRAGFYLDTILTGEYAPAKAAWMGANHQLRCGAELVLVFTLLP